MSNVDVSFQSSSIECNDSIRQCEHSFKQKPIADFLFNNLEILYKTSRFRIEALGVVCWLRETKIVNIKHLKAFHLICAPLSVPIFVEFHFNAFLGSFSHPCKTFFCCFNPKYNQSLQMIVKPNNVWNLVPFKNPNRVIKMKFYEQLKNSLNLVVKRQWPHRQ